MTLGPPDQDELLSSAGMPRWVRWVGAAGAVGVLVALVVVKSRTDSPESRPSGAASVAPATPSVASVPVSGAQRVVLPDPARPLYDVVSDESTTWVLRDDVLLWRTTGDWAQIALNRPVTAEAGQPTLVLDRDAGRLWVVVLGIPRSTIEAFDTTTHYWTAAIPWPRALISAAPLRGSLYVADNSGLSRVEPDARTPTRIEVPGNQQILDLAPDPRHGRALMLVQAASGLRVSGFGAYSVTISSPAPYGLVKGWLGVTGAGQIWVAGFGRSGAVLVRLDPESLQTVQVSPLTNQLGPGALLLASGSGSLLIGSGSGIAALWCIEDQVGAPVQRWPMAALRAGSSRGLVYAVLSTGLVRLRTEGACVG